mmetsp:Transcript_43731/g.126342  ORF Transcript_43731/g.126342 Transcript_43731/m.126342 type:complete len:226 (+) Transcript_43731:1336-2013(+)
MDGWCEAQSSWTGPQRGALPGEHPGRVRRTAALPLRRHWAKHYCGDRVLLVAHRRRLGAWADEAAEVRCHERFDASARPLRTGLGLELLLRSLLHHRLVRGVHVDPSGALLHVRHDSGRLCPWRGLHCHALPGERRRRPVPSCNALWDLPQPGRAEREPHGAARSFAAGVHQAILARGRHQAIRHPDPGAARHGHCVGRPDRSGGSAGDDDGVRGRLALSSSCKD